MYLFSPVFPVCTCPVVGFVGHWSGTVDEKSKETNGSFFLLTCDYCLVTRVAVFAVGSLV